MKRPNVPLPLSLLVLIVGLLLSLSSTAIYAQNELAATLEVLSAGVEVKRVNTTNWVAVRVEGIVGVGDRIRTDATGRGRITFFADGTETELLPDSEIGVLQFTGDETQFTIELEVLIGETIHRLSRLLDANSSYNVETPAMNLVARGTEFRIRVETGGRSAMLVDEGTVDANAETVENEADSAASADVPPDFGVRAEPEAGLSDVVRASTFAELDAALDGCTAVLTTLDDVSLNVRAAPNRDAERIGTVGADEIVRLFGQTAASEWYRIDLDGNFGWVLSTTANVADDCIGLREFLDDYAGEGASADTANAAEATPEADAP